MTLLIHGEGSRVSPKTCFGTEKGLLFRLVPVLRTLRYPRDQLVSSKREVSSSHRPTGPTTLSECRGQDLYLSRRRTLETYVGFRTRRKGRPVTPGLLLASRRNPCRHGPSWKERKRNLGPTPVVAIDGPL